VPERWCSLAVGFLGGVIYSWELELSVSVTIYKYLPKLSDANVLIVLRFKPCLLDVTAAYYTVRQQPDDTE
jgi:hypothetical protein